MNWPLYLVLLLYYLAVAVSGFFVGYLIGVSVT